MAFHHIVGQKRAIHVLQKGLANSRLAQAYLFHGPSSTGKKLTALQFAQTLHCPAATTDACDTCVPCRADIFCGSEVRKKCMRCPIFPFSGTWRHFAALVEFEFFGLG